MVLGAGALCFVGRCEVLCCEMDLTQLLEYGAKNISDRFPSKDTFFLKFFHQNTFCLRVHMHQSSYLPIFLLDNLNLNFYNNLTLPAEIIKDFPIFACVQCLLPQDLQ